MIPAKNMHPNPTRIPASRHGLREIHSHLNVKCLFFCLTICNGGIVGLGSDKNGFVREDDGRFGEPILLLSSVVRIRRVVDDSRRHDGEGRTAGFLFDAFRVVRRHHFQSRSLVAQVGEQRVQFNAVQFNDNV